MIFHTICILLGKRTTGIKLYIHS